MAEVRLVLFEENSISARTWFLLIFGPVVFMVWTSWSSPTLTTTTLAGWRESSRTFIHKSCGSASTRTHQLWNGCTAWPPPIMSRFAATWLGKLLIGQEHISACFHRRRAGIPSQSLRTTILFLS